MMDLGTAGERIEIHAPGRNEVHASWSFSSVQSDAIPSVLRRLSMAVRCALKMSAIKFKRAISTGKLNALPRLHTRPINVVVYHGS